MGAEVTAPLVKGWDAFQYEPKESKITYSVSKAERKLNMKIELDGCKPNKVYDFGAHCYKCPSKEHSFMDEQAAAGKAITREGVTVQYCGGLGREWGVKCDASGKGFLEVQSDALLPGAW